MSVASDFRAALAAHAPLTAIVGNRIAQNAVPQGGAYPLVTFVTEEPKERGLDGTLHAAACVITAQCWGKTAESAAAAADAVQAALLADATALAHDCTVTSRASAFDPELDLDAEQLQIEWWVKA